MLAASKVKNKRQRKKKRTGTQPLKFFESKYDISSIKRVTRKFHVLVVQNNDKEINKKVCCMCKAVFCCSRCRRRFALHDFIFVCASILKFGRTRGRVDAKREERDVF